jgi:hypothetical protein
LLLLLLLLLSSPPFHCTAIVKCVWLSSGFDFMSSVDGAKPSHSLLPLPLSLLLLPLFWLDFGWLFEFSCLPSWISQIAWWQSVQHNLAMMIVYNRIFKDTGLYTIVIPSTSPSTSPHPTPLERRRKGTHDSSWVDVLFQYHFGCCQVRIKMSLGPI